MPNLGKSEENEDYMDLAEADGQKQGSRSSGLERATSRSPQGRKERSTAEVEEDMDSVESRVQHIINNPLPPKQDDTSGRLFLQKLMNETFEMELVEPPFTAQSLKGSVMSWPGNSNDMGTASSVAKDSGSMMSSERFVDETSAQESTSDLPDLRQVLLSSVHNWPSNSSSGSRPNMGNTEVPQRGIHQVASMHNLAYGQNNNSSNAQRMSNYLGGAGGSMSAMGGMSMGGSNPFAMMAPSALGGMFGGFDTSGGMDSMNTSGYGSSVSRMGMQGTTHSMRPDYQSQLKQKADLLLKRPPSSEVRPRARNWQAYLDSSGVDNLEEYVQESRAELVDKTDEDIAYDLLRFSRNERGSGSQSPTNSEGSNSSGEYRGTRTGTRSGRRERSGSTSKLLVSESSVRHERLRSASRILNDWFYDNFRNPYPSYAQKLVLVDKTGLSMSQLNNWFGNKRIRVKRQLKKIAKSQ